MNALTNMAPMPNLAQGDRIVHLGRRLVYNGELGEGLLDIAYEAAGNRFLVIDQDDGTTAMPTVNWLTNELAAGHVTFERLRRRGNRVIPIPPMANAEIEGQEPAAIEITRKLRWLRALDERPDLRFSDASLHAFIAITSLKPEFQRYPAPHPSTLRRWYNNRGVPGERCIGDMRCGRGRYPRLSALDPVVAKAMNRYVARYWADRALSMTDAYGLLTTLVAHLEDRKVGRRRLTNGQYANRLHKPSPDLLDADLHCPSFETFRRRLNAAQNRMTYEARYGAKAAEELYRTNLGSPTATRILERAELDHTTFDAFCVVDTNSGAILGRPTICIMVDVYSGCPIGWFTSFGSPSHHTACESIRRANAPKVAFATAHPNKPDLKYLYGRPATLVVDNALENVSGSFRDAMMEMGVAVAYAPPGEGRWKGVVERLHDTVRTKVATKVPGGIRGTIEERRKFGIDPEAEAILDLETLNRLIEEAIAVYVYEPNRKTKTMPIKRWLDSAKEHGIDVIADVTVLEKIMGRAKECCLTRNGIELNGLDYNDARKVARLLDNLASRTPKRRRRSGSATATVKVKFNPADLSHIHVYDDSVKEYVTLPCTDADYSNGLSLWAHSKITSFARAANLEFFSERERHEARRQMYRQLCAIAPQLTGKVRKQAARFLSEQPTLGQMIGATIEYAEPRHDGGGPVIVPHATLEGIRNDGGSVPRTVNRRSKKPQSRSVRGQGTSAPKAPKYIPARVSTAPNNDAFLDGLAW